MKIFIGNLSSEATEEELKKSFEKFGQVDSVTVLGSLLDTEDEAGMGFIEMADEGQARKAIKKLNQKILFGAKLNVHEARSAATDRRVSGRGGGRRNTDLPENNNK